MEPDRIATVEKREERRAPRVILWLLGIPGDLIFILFGLGSFVSYPEFINNSENGVNPIGLATAVLSLIALWLNIILIHHDVKRKQKMPIAILVIACALLTLVPGTGTLFLLILAKDKTRFWPYFWPFIVALLVVSMGLFLGGLFKAPKAIKREGKLALAVGVSFLIFIAFITPYAFIKQYEDDRDHERRVALGACRDNLRTIDSAIMQYAAATNGVYPNGTSDLLGTYVRAPFPTCHSANGLPYTYSGAGTNAMRAACPNGHTY